MTGIQSMPAEMYRAAAGISKSELDWIASPRTPAHYAARFIYGTIKDEETPAKRMGTLVHRVLLEPDTLNGAFHIQPESLFLPEARVSKLASAEPVLDGEELIRNERGDVAVKWNGVLSEAKAWVKEHSDRQIISFSDWKTIQGMRDALWKHPLAKRLLTNAQTEQNLFAKDENGVLRKGRVDALKSGFPIIDLKTVEGADEEWFFKQNGIRRWFVQAAYYVALADLLDLDCTRQFVAIAVEKSPPFDVVCYDFTDLLSAGRMCFQRDLALLQSCKESNKWPGRSDKFEPAGLPAWAMKQLEEAA